MEKLPLLPIHTMPPYVAPSTSANPQPLPISRYSARSSYYGSTGFHPSEGLQRARRPFRFKNALTGLAILSFVGMVYGYSISAVKQDDFSDIPTVSSAPEGSKSIEEEMAERKKGNRGVGAMFGLGSSPQGEGVKVTQALESPSQTTPMSSPTPVSVPVPATPSAKAPGVAAADALIQQQERPVNVQAVQSRPRSRWIVGAPDVDRLGKMHERSEQDSTIDGRRVV